MVYVENAQSSKINIFIDLEWERAQISAGAPLSIGAVRSDCDDTIYGRWPLYKKRCSEWTKLQVLPKLEKDALPASMALTTLKEWTSHPNTVVWASEPAVQEWLREAYAIESSVWPGVLSEHEQIQLWWSTQKWLDKNPSYHALWDAKGLLHQWRTINPSS